MDTMVDVTIATTKNTDAMGEVWNSIDSFLSDWDRRFADTGTASEINAINERTTPKVAVDPALGEMIADALRFGDTTAGMFDITILPLKNIWGLGYIEREEKRPSPDTIREVLGRIGYRYVHVNKQHDTLTFDRSGITIDAGGFAKGYALIRLGTLLDAKGFRHYLVASGDIISRGRRYDGRPWVIGIQHPRKPDAILATVTLDSGVIFTSGDYERRWISDPMVHHIFNPKTGLSCTKNQSLTIWSPDPVTAKFLSTGLYGMRADSILAFVKQRPLEAVIVDSLGTVTVSPGWKNRVTLQTE